MSKKIVTRLPIILCHNVYVSFPNAYNVSRELGGEKYKTNNSFAAENWQIQVLELVGETTAVTNKVKLSTVKNEKKKEIEKARKCKKKNIQN